MKTDVLSVGSGCSGLYCALNLPKNLCVTVISKAKLDESNSFLAQGGICVQRDDSDFDAFFEDTMKAGHYENDPESVKIMIDSSRDVIKDLLDCGVEFAKKSNGEFNYTKEGAHSNHRILFYKDITGKEITSKLLAEAKRRENITLYEDTTLLDLVAVDGQNVGAVIKKNDGKLEIVEAPYTVLASGGIGGIFKHSTNYRHLTADALAIAIEQGIELKNISYIQIHPTTFYNKDEGTRSFLISESVRGEGAKLYDKNMERFANELLPRDLLTKEILKRMEIDGTEHVWEDMRVIPIEERESHFPNIIGHCKENGYDPGKECIPVVPAQHYFMGGIKVNYSSKTSREALWAVGETACNGVHGKNRLASNSLLEGLVFAKRAAHDIAATKLEGKEMPSVDLSKYSDLDMLSKARKQLVLDEIERDKKNV